MKKRLILSIILVIALLFSSCAGQKEGNKLSNPNANAKTQAIYEYLCSVEGTATISGQQESTWMTSSEYEMEYVYNATGKYPAIRGLDYMNDDFEGVNERALDWWNRGGLVSICWHMGSDFSGAWDECMKTDLADWDRALTEGTEEYEALISGMDKAAKALSELQDEGVTVLWRPFHEADGMWFWWGKGDNRNFKKLWRIMYTRYTEHWGLNNLIWVFGFSHNGVKINKWYPGDKYCDIVGGDDYAENARPDLYEIIKKVHAKDKPICYHECGKIPTAEEFKETPWLWFLAWHTEFLTDANTPEELKTLYSSENIITLDELPEF